MTLQQPRNSATADSLGKQIERPAWGEARWTSIAAAIDLMRKDLASEHSLTNIARTHFYSNYHFLRIFRQATGVPPAQFLAALRMQRAKELLSTTADSAASVGAAVGYQSVGTFTTQFTRLTGISPGRFRDLARRATGLAVSDVLATLPTVHCPKLRLIAQHAIDLTPMAHVVGFFSEAIPRGTPRGFALLDESLTTRVENRGADGTYMVLAFAIPRSAPLIDLATGSSDLLIAGCHASLSMANPPIVLKFRSADLGDPPLLSAAPLIYLSNVIDALSSATGVAQTTAP